MDKILNFLTKSLVDQAAVIIDSEGFPKNRGGSKYAVSINGKQYPYKLLVTEAAKITGENIAMTLLNIKVRISLSSSNFVALSLKLIYFRL